MSESVDGTDDATVLGYARANQRERAWNVRRAVVFVLLVAAIGGGGYFVKRARDLAALRLESCRRQLQGIVQAAHIYAQDSDEFPPNFDWLLHHTLGGGDLISAFKCPATNVAIGNLNACYLYIPGQRPNSDPRNVLAYEKRGHHGGDAANVVFVDAHAATIYGYDNVMKLVKETEVRLKTAATQPAGGGR